MSADPQAAYRAALAAQDWAAAYAAFIAAVQADGKRFAPFPVGRYRPLSILGADAAGVWFAATHKVTGDPVQAIAVAPEHAAAALAAAAGWKDVAHPAVAKVIETGYVDAAARDRAFIITSHLDAPTLAAFVDQEGLLDPADALPVLRQLAAALKAGHERGLAHGGLAPERVRLKLARVNGARAWQTHLTGFGLPAAAEFRGDPTPAGDAAALAKALCFGLFQTPRPQPRNLASLPENLAAALRVGLAGEAAGGAGLLQLLSALQPPAPPAGKTEFGLTRTESSLPAAPPPKAGKTDADVHLTERNLPAAPPAPSRKTDADVRVTERNLPAAPPPRALKTEPDLHLTERALSAAPPVSSPPPRSGEGRKPRRRPPPPWRWPRWSRSRPC